MKNLLKIRCTFQAPILASVVIAFASFYLCATWGQAWLLLLGLAMAIAINIWAHLPYMDKTSTQKTISSVSDKVTAFVLLAAYMLMSVSLTRYAINALASEGMGLFSVTVTVVSVFFVALTAFEIYFIAHFVEFSKPSAIWSQNKFTIISLSVLSLILIVLNLEIFHAWFRWDSYEYYAYADRQTLRSLTNLGYMRLANHATYACTLLYMLFNGIVGDYAIAIYLVNLLMLISGPLLFFGIARRFCKTNVFPFAVSCVYAFSPFTFGLVYSISLETFLAFGLLLFFYGEAKKIPIFQILASLLICFSKETGAVILVAIMALKLARYLFSKERAGLPFVKRINLSLTAPIFVCGLFWLWDFFAFSWISSNTNSKMQIAGKTFNNFALSFTYIKDRIISFLFTNFTWTLVIIIVVGFLVGMIRRKKLNTDGEEKDFLWLVMTAFCASLVPMLLFVTYNHVRYVTPTWMLLMILLPFALKRLFANVKVLSLICVLLTVASFVQCYFTIDPAMYLFYNTIDKGKGKIVYTSNHIITDNVKRTQAICVSSQYNREIMYFDVAMNSLLNQIDYDSNTCLVLSSEYMEPSIEEYVKAEYLIWGFGYPYTDYPRYVSYSQKNKKLYLATDRAEMIHFIIIDHPTCITPLHLMYDRVIYIQLPFRDQEVEEKLLLPYDRKEIARTDVNGWELVAYEIMIKP